MSNFLPPLDWMKQVIRIDSVTHKSNEEIVRFLAPLLSDSDLRVEEQEIVEGGVRFKNLLAFSHSSQKDLLALNTHLDTVSGGTSSDWTSTGGDPLEATVVGNKIYGLGTADVKLDFLCKIMAARAARPWKRPFVLVGTFGEERGLIGAQHLLKEKKIKPKYALVGEPSNLELIYAHKGHIIVTLALRCQVSYQTGMEKQWKGKAAHSSTPHLGKNAIDAALSEIAKKRWGILSIDGGTEMNRIPDRCQAKVAKESNFTSEKLLALHGALKKLGVQISKKKDRSFNPSQCTLSVNQLVTEAGRILVTFDIRALPHIDTDKIKKQITQIAKANGADVVSLVVDEPLRGKKDSRLIKNAAQALKRAGHKNVSIKTKASSTEAAVYNSYGAEALVFGPGLSIGNVHRPNEHNLFNQMATAVRFYTEMLSLSAKEL